MPSLYPRLSLFSCIQLLEARSTDGKYDLTLQLKTEVQHTDHRNLSHVLLFSVVLSLVFCGSQVSEMSGQAAELRQQVQRSEKELREALRMVERKQYEVCVCVCVCVCARVCFGGHLEEYWTLLLGCTIG